MSTAANAAAAPSGLHCEVWQPQDFSESHCSSSSSSSSFQAQSPEFFIDFYVSSYANHGEEIITTVHYKNFRQTQDSFSWSAISCMLSETNVPFHLQPFFIQHISIRARRIATLPDNALSRTIPIVVELVLPDEDIDGDYDESINRGSIEEMERVEIDHDRDRDCVICLDEIDVSIDDVVRMPCLHFYHRNCIRKWLRFSDLCPLCRFQMPKEEQ